MNSVQPALFVEEVVPVHFDGRHSVCSICGRYLSNPYSVALGIGPVCGGRCQGEAGHHHSKPGGLAPSILERDMNATIDTLFNFKDPNGRLATCRLRTYKTTDGLGPVVLLSEVAGNPGMSVTNSAERLIPQAANFLGLEGGGVRWVEHYDNGSYPGGRREGITYDLVTIQDGRAGWKHLGSEEVQTILGIPAMDELTRIHLAAAPGRQK